MCAFCADDTPYRPKDLSPWQGPGARRSTAPRHAARAIRRSHSGCRHGNDESQRRAPLSILAPPLRRRAAASRCGTCSATAATDNPSPIAICRSHSRRTAFPAAARAILRRSAAPDPAAADIRPCRAPACGIREAPSCFTNSAPKAAFKSSSVAHRVACRRVCLAQIELRIRAIGGSRAPHEQHAPASARESCAQIRATPIGQQRVVALLAIHSASLCEHPSRSERSQRPSASTAAAAGGSVKQRRLAVAINPRCFEPAPEIPAPGRSLNNLRTASAS